jgi:hypothetical protein
MQGYYPLGTKGTGQAFVPDESLVHLHTRYKYMYACDVHSLGQGRSAGIVSATVRHRCTCKRGCCLFSTMSFLLFFVTLILFFLVIVIVLVFAVVFYIDLVLSLVFSLVFCCSRC